MMTLEELRVAKINPGVAREAFDQAEKRLADILETRKAHEQKAFALFSGYLTVALGLFAAGVALLNDKQAPHLVLTFWLGAVIFIVGAICLVLALLDARYGAMGSDPEAWLQTGVIDGGGAALPLMLAYLTYLYQERIDRSASANETKSGWIRAGIFIGILAPLLTVPCLFVPDASLKAFL